MSALKFVALIRKEPETDYWIDVPDIPGCVASGNTAEEAKNYFREALDAHIAGQMEDGWTLPEPRSLDQVLSEEEPKDYVDSYIIEVEGG